MSRASDRLREFHEAFEVERPTAEKDSIKRVAKVREKLHVEEHIEVEGALDPMTRFGAPAGRKLARELADTLVIAYGTADLFGIDLDAAFDAVMDANMAKLPVCETCGGKGLVRYRNAETTRSEYERGGGGERTCSACVGTGKGKPIKRHDGKVMKPEGWQEPDMSGAVLLPTELDRRDLRLGRFEGVVVGREGAKIHVLLKPDPRLRSTPTLAADPLPEGMVIPRRGEDCMVEVGPGFEWARMVP